MTWFACEREAKKKKVELEHSDTHLHVRFRYNVWYILKNNVHFLENVLN